MLIALLLSCVLDDKHDTDSGTDTAGTCEEVETDFSAELLAVQACTEDAECGQPLVGTSCGCTRNLVARTDADTTTLYALIDQANDLECDLGLESTCDCPVAYGYLCDAGTCAWALDTGAWLPDCRAERGDSYTIESVSLDGDTLLVTAGTGGGCETHEWQICWPDQAFAQSDPVQASLELWHDSHDDPCDAWLTEELRYDLTPLANAWKEAYGGSSGTIIVRVDTESVTYSF